GEYVGALNSAEAQASGLQVGDVITAIDGTELTSETVLRSAINAKKPGETVELTVYRPSSNQTVTVTLTLSETTESATTAQAQDSAG
ncbi:MAG: PDZ domain-containing protein, partial [Acutalibacteraceae bacterium]